MNDPGSTPSGTGGRRRLLFIQSGSVEAAAGALAAFAADLGDDPELTYLTHDPEIVPPRPLLPRRTEVLVAGHDWRSHRALRRRLAGRRWDRIVFLLTGEPGYRRFKALALSLAGRPFAVYDETGACWVGAAGLLRLLRRRFGRGSAGRETAAATPATAPAPPTEAVASSPPPAEPAPPPPLPRLVLPRCERPAVSVVLPLVDEPGDGPGAGLDCLRSIAETAAGIGCEVIVVGSGTAGGLAGAEARLENARAVRAPAGTGLAGAWNAGAAVARGDALLLLTAEALLAPGCLEALAATLARDPGCGAVGPRAVDAAGRLVEAGGIVWRDGSTCAVGAGADPEAPSFTYVREADYGSSVALLVRRALYERIGGCEPGLDGAECAADLCFGLHALGYTTLVQPAATVALRRAPAAPAEPSERFRARWRVELARQLDADPDRVFLARERPRRKIMLVIDHYVPTHDKDAGSFVMLRVLLTLKRLGYRVVFWPDNLYRLPGYTDELQRAGIEVVYGVTSFESFLAERARWLDGILIHRAVMASKYLERIGRDGPPVFYICADLEHLREERRAALNGGASARVRALWQRELEILDRVDRAAIHSPVEREHLAAVLPDKRISVLPLPVRPAALEGAPFTERRGLLFVGSTHPPNVDAVEHWVDRLAPRVARRLPGVALTVIGEASKAFAERRPEALNGRVRLAGFVPAIEEYYRSSRVFVAPLRYGAGVKGKILEAMSNGLPVVTTSIGAEGIPIAPGADALVADDEDAFADAVAELYGCRETWETVRANGRRLIDEHYSDHAFEAALRELVGD